MSNFAGELESLNQNPDQEQLDNLIEHALPQPESMIEVVKASISSKFNEIIQDYPYLIDRQYKIPPREVDYGMAAHIINSLGEFRDGDLPQEITEDYTPHIVEEPHEVPTFSNYVGMLRRNWDSDGCFSCGFCIDGQLGRRTRRLATHQSQIYYAVAVFAEMGDDESIVEIAEKSILDGLEALTLANALKVNPYLPRTLAQLEYIVTKEDYITFSSAVEMAKFSELLISKGIKLSSFSKNNQSWANSSYNLDVISRLKHLFLNPSLEKARMIVQLDFTDPSRDVTSRMAAASSEGFVLDALSLARETMDKPIDYYYAYNWLLGYLSVKPKELVSARINPESHAKDYENTHLAYGLAYVDMLSFDEAYLHALAAELPARLEIMFALANAGDERALTYLETKTKLDS